MVYADIDVDEGTPSLQITNQYLLPVPSPFRDPRNDVAYV